MSAALSLLDEDPFEHQPATTRLPAVPSAGLASRVANPTGATGAGHRGGPGALDPHVIGDRETFARALRPGGISIPTLIIATLIASPAIFQFAVRHSISVSTMLQRWVVITLGCWLLWEVLRRVLAWAQAAQTAATQADADGSAKAAQVLGDGDELPPGLNGSGFTPGF